MTKLRRKTAVPFCFVQNAYLIRNLFWTNRTTISPPVHEFFTGGALRVPGTFSGAPVRALEYSRICNIRVVWIKVYRNTESRKFSWVEAIDTVIEWFEHVNQVSQTRWIRSEKCATFIDFGIEVARRIRFGASKRQKGPTGGGILDHLGALCDHSGAGWQK